MLLEDFFNITEKKITVTSLLATIDLNAMHHIFDGHFPGQPVVPGVCMMQIFKETLETIIDKKIQLVKADYLKFLAVVNPLVNPTIQIEFSFEQPAPEQYVVTGRLFKDAISFLKFKGTFKQEF